MANISVSDKKLKLALLRRAIEDNVPFCDVCRSLNADGNNLRLFMHRNGVALPDAWKPRPWTRRADKPKRKPYYAKKGIQPAYHTRAALEGRKTSAEGMALTADPCELTDEEKVLADKMRIPRERMAYLLKCPRGGNAHGWRGGSAIG